MTSTLSRTAVNAHIAALEPVFDQALTPVQWLVIAHNNARVVDSLMSALAGESAAVLEVSQDTWDFHGGELAETIEWALQQGEVAHLVLVGSSQVGGTQIRATRAPAKTVAQADARCDKLLAGIHRLAAQHREVQDRFAEQVQQVSRIPVVHRRWRGGELAVYGLFYRAESGLFLAYDVDTDTYRPLCS
ncbi:MAG: hypothetical protein MUF48_04775 [Pirellulaceae bacterium]|jgi:carbonic anhydrase|nr:hypothetical protein [Pirellulaceae bacterium]